MTEIKTPGAPGTDVLARNAARNAIAAHIENTEPEAEGGYLADLLLNDLIEAVTWERDVNSVEVAVRRYVLRGSWEVDPTAKTAQIVRGDVVVYGDRRDDGREWTVEHVVNDYLISMSSPGLDEVAERQDVTRGEVVVLRRGGERPPTMAERAEADSYCAGKHQGAVQLLMDLIEAFRVEPGAQYSSPEVTIRAVAARRGVTL